MIKEGQYNVYWLIESGLNNTPYYFCMAMINNSPVWTLDIDKAQKFKTEDMALSVVMEWCLENTRIVEHEFEE